MVILELIHAKNWDLTEPTYLLDKESIPSLSGLMNHNNCLNRTAFALAIVHSNFCPISFRR